MYTIMRGDRRRLSHRTAGALFVSISGVLLLLFCIVPASAESDCQGRLYPKATHFGRPRYEAEVTACLEADSTYALLRIEVPYTELSFRKRGDIREANFDLIVHIFENDRLIKADMWPEQIRVSGRDEIRSREARFRKDITFVLAPGRYEFEVRLSEANSGIEGTVCLRLNMPIRIPGRIFLSSLLTGDCGLNGSIPELRNNPGIRDGFLDAVETICAYLSLYHRGADVDSVQVTWELISPGGKTIDSGAFAGAAGLSETRLSWPITVKDLWLDIYRLKTIVTAGDHRLPVSTSFSMLTESKTALASFFKESFDVLSYIADETEIRKLRMAAPQHRKRLWDEFWAARDPIPETEINEFKEQFFRRIRIANEMFGGVRAGWQTDRGRIFIIHGDPDEVTRDNYSSWGRPMVIWYYNRLQLQFVFIDRRGFGEYELAGSDW